MRDAWPLRGITLATMFIWRREALRVVPHGYRLHVSALSR